MMIVTLICCIAGDGSLVHIKIKKNKLVGCLKVFIKEKKPRTITVDADKVQLFLAKTADGAWLSSDSEDVETLKQGGKTVVIDAILEEKELHDAAGILDILEDEPPVKTMQIHLLVVVPSGIKITIGEIANKVFKAELEYYQKRGKLIQINHREYCKEILDKIDEHYACDRTPLPSICVQGSSGMGKTQLAFALGGGTRPWFYWPATDIGQGSQKIYQIFKSISVSFCEVTVLDKPTERSEKVILNSTSSVYMTAQLWTYGFIRALLEYSSLDENQHPRMIRFDEKTSFLVEKCDRNAVRAVVAKMKKAGKILPFFILDEMSIQNDGGKKTVAFQLNVFLACGLVVVVMGTDAKTTNLFTESGGP